MDESIHWLLIDYYICFQQIKVLIENQLWKFCWWLHLIVEMRLFWKKYFRHSVLLSDSLFWGYGHEDAKLAAVKDATGGAYRRDFESTDADTGLARSAWSKHSADKERRGFGFDHGARVQGVSEHGKSGRTDGWKSIESGNVSDHRDHHCQQD